MVAKLPNLEKERTIQVWTAFGTPKAHGQKRISLRHIIV
jgi:hypothetical protein